MGVLALMLTGILAHYTWIAVEVAEISGLRAENLALATKAKAYEENAGQLQAKLLALQSMVNKLGVMAGVEQSLPDAAVGGVGGLTRARDDGALGRHRRRLSAAWTRPSANLTEKSTRLEAFFRDQRQLLASTPSIWPVRGYLSANFGNRIDPFTGQPDFHPGLDISTPIGTKVIAPADGVVVFCGAEERLRQRPRHRPRLRDRHPLRPPRRRSTSSPGQRVRRGDVIGFVGNTGRSTAPHLHYEVWVDDQAQNPIQFILDEYRSFG